MGNVIELAVEFTCEFCGKVAEATAKCQVVFGNGTVGFSAMMVRPPDGWSILGTLGAEDKTDWICDRCEAAATGVMEIGG